jgi:hypothetical protein
MEIKAKKRILEVSTCIIVKDDMSKLFHRGNNI